jgi:hypothetical protein
MLGKRGSSEYRASTIQIRDFHQLWTGLGRHVSKRFTRRSEKRLRPLNERRCVVGSRGAHEFFPPINSVCLWLRREDRGQRTRSPPPGRLGRHKQVAGLSVPVSPRSTRGSQAPQTRVIHALHAWISDLSQKHYVRVAREENM